MSVRNWISQRVDQVLDVAVDFIVKRFDFKLSDLFGESELSGIIPIENKPKKALIIDDDLDITLVLKKELESLGYNVNYALDKASGLELLKETKPEKVFLDWNLGSEKSNILLDEYNDWLDENASIDFVSDFNLITFSSEDITKIDIPKSSNYKHLKHIDKHDFNKKDESLKDQITS
ncbi:MAG: hypothetical protein AB8E15_01425 [Bdellovibrionales bacterium]